MTFNRREEDRVRAEQDREELEQIYAATPADWMFIAAGVIAFVGLCVLAYESYGLHHHMLM
jgi:hypothetical protein